MKKLFNLTLFTSVLLLTSNSIFAQIEQDQWMINGASNLSFQSAKFDNSVDQRRIDLSSTIGYFVKDNLAFGLRLGLANSKSGNNTSNELTVGPFARYYFSGLFFTGLGYSVNQITRELDTVEITDTGSQFSIEFGYPIWVLIEQLTIEPTLNYNIGMGDLLKGSNSLSLNIGFSLYF